ncbi:MAG: glycogen synthase [Proteobacteria bacterium]|nr:glycogen synthase [Pseudomonadota bacterium]
MTMAAGTRGDEDLSVMMVAAEAVPFAKVGGLADVIGALPASLREAGIRVSVFLPFYREIRKKGFDPTPTGSRFSLLHDGIDRECRILHAERDGVSFFFLDEPDFFDREWVYGPPGGEYPDSALRFSFFCRSCLAAAEKMGLEVDLIHCHDWHAALVPLYLKFAEVSTLQAKIPSLLTIHNLAYQGRFDPGLFPSLGLGREALDGGYLELWGSLNFLKGGILTADAVSTVSPAYAEEITTPEQGMGMDPLLGEKGVRGILNGIDFGLWNPETDPHLAVNYSSADPSGKTANLKALREELGLDPLPEAPLFAFIGRLVHQKGADVIAGGMDEIIRRGFQFVVLGSGERQVEESLLSGAARHRKMAFARIGFDDELARKIYASADFFLMPSRFEPCGLGQMIAMRYGCIPVVRATGGLRDTVTDLGSDPERGNGFAFEGDTVQGLLEALDRAAGFFREGRAGGVLPRIMAQDNSWGHSAEAYARFYREIIEGKKGEAGR